MDQFYKLQYVWHKSSFLPKRNQNYWKNEPKLELKMVERIPFRYFFFI
jgi:hypothetical protein